MFYVLAANLEECKKLLAILPMCILYSVCFSYKSGGVNKLWVIQMVYVLCSRYKSGGVNKLWVIQMVYVLCSRYKSGGVNKLWVIRWCMCYVPGTSQELDYGLKGGHMCYVQATV